MLYYLFLIYYKLKYGCIEDYAIKASKNGDVQFLEWFKHSGYEFKYDEWAINYASLNGNVQVLEWFKNSGYKLKYDEDAINWATSNDQVKVLKWFKNYYNIKKLLNYQIQFTIKRLNIKLKITT